LNEEQYRVVTEADGPCLVLAGAGSGKTRTLVFRVAYLIEQGICPENILLVTFTNKAAKEMMDRVERLLGFKPDDLLGGTFHHVGNLILRKNATKLGYKNNFNILDQDDSTTLIKQAMASLALNVKGQNFPKASVVQAIISYARNTNREVKEIAGEYYDYPDFIADKVREIEFVYEQKKKAGNLMDFDDLLINWLKLLVDFPEVKNRYRKQFKYILVDEYQDTNFVQAEIIREMSDFHNNVLVVGDDSQSIYSFRAADVRNILSFPKAYPKAKIFKIETNYRSTPQILQLANSIIRHNVDQFEKTLLPHREQSKLPVLIPARDNYQQANIVTRKILKFYEEGHKFNEMAILYRSNYQSAEIQLELSKQNIPYVVRGGMRYFAQAHIKDVVAYLKVLANFQDELAWKRILMLYEGIGMKSADAIYQRIKKFGELAELIDQNIKLKGKGAESLQKIVETFKHLMTLSHGDAMDIAEAVEYILEHGYESYLKNTYENYKERMDDLTQLLNFVALYKDLGKLLSDVMLSENFEGEKIGDKPAVILSTIHQAKGLEWPMVFIIGLRDGYFPHHKSIDNQSDLEEERRLFYVAVTRARDELIMLYPIRAFSYKFGDVYSEPSMFIRELKPELYLEEGRADRFANREGKEPFEDDFDSEKVIYYD